MATSVPESHPLLVETRESRSRSSPSPSPSPSQSHAHGQSWAKVAGVAAVGVGALLGVALFLPSNHVNKTYEALQAKAAKAAAAEDNSRASVRADDDAASIDYDTVSAEQLWKHLDHPDNVLSFARFHMLKEMNISEVSECG